MDDSKYNKKFEGLGDNPTIQVNFVRKNIFHYEIM